MDHFRNIEIFVAVARAGGFRAAAELLSLPNSTVFNRTTRRVELTESGRAYFVRCQALVEEAEAAYAELTSQARNPSGLIRASLPVDFATERIAAIITEFVKSYPLVRFELDLSPRQSDLVAEPVDFVVRIGRPNESNLVQRKLTEVSIGLFGAPSYLATRNAPTHPSDFAGHSLMTVLGRPLLFSKAGGPAVSVQPVAPAVMNNVSWLKHFALAGLGLAALPPDMIRPELATGTLVPVLPDWVQPTVEVYVLTETRLLPARVRLFLDYLIDHINAYASWPI